VVLVQLVRVPGQSAGDRPSRAELRPDLSRI